MQKCFINNFSPEIHQEFTSDFGRYITAYPKYISLPQSAQEVKETFEFARQSSLPISIRGHAHTTGGQTLNDNGVLISTKLLSKVGEAHQDSSGSFIIEAEAGASWKSVFDHCLSVNMTPRTYSDWLHLSVGGTISTGGVGQCSFRNGLQIDNVAKMEIVQYDGQILSCSAEENTELFNAARGGYGFSGVITKVQIYLEPAPTHVLVYKIIYDNVHDFIQDQILLTTSANVSAIQSHVVTHQQEEIERRVGQSLSKDLLSLLNKSSPWIFVLEVSIYIHDINQLPSIEERQKLIFSDLLFHKSDLIFSKTALFSTHVTRVPPILDTPLEKDNPPHHHCCTFIPAEHVETFLSETLAYSSYENMGGGTILIIPMKKSVINTIYFSLPSDENFFMIAFLRRQLKEYCNLKELENINEKIYGNALEKGGTIYPCGSGEMLKTKDFWNAYNACFFKNSSTTQHMFTKNYAPK